MSMKSGFKWKNNIKQKREKMYTQLVNGFVIKAVKMNEEEEELF